MTTKTKAGPTPTPATPTVWTGPGSPVALQTARRLRDLAMHPMLLGRREQLEALTEALTDPDKSSRWEHVSLHSVLGYPIPPESSGEHRWLRWLEGLRTVLVFAPVFSTWLGVSMAAGQYRNALRKNHDLEAASFFRLWLNGFDGKLWFTFQVMAVVTAVLVMALLLTNIVVGVLRSHQDVKAETRSNRLLDQLNAALTDASLHLAQARLTAPDRLRQEADAAAQGLMSLTKQVNAAATTANDSILRASAASQAVQQAAVEMRSSASTLAGTVVDLNGHVKTNEAATSRLLQDLQTRGEASADHAAKVIDSSVGGLRDAAIDLLIAVQQQATRAEQGRDSVGLLLDEQRTFLAKWLGDVMTPMITDRDELTKNLNHLNKAVRGLADLPRALNGEVRALSAAVKSLDRRLASLQLMPVGPAPTQAQQPEYETWGMPSEYPQQSIPDMGPESTSPPPQRRWWRRH